MPKLLKYSLLALLWSGVAVYILWSAIASGRERAARTVSRIVIEVADSSEHGYLVSAPKVRQWLRQSGIATLGTRVDEVDLQGLENMIVRNGFVDKAKAYINYDAELHLRISQHSPVVRLLTDGMNGYATAEGYVFPAPRAASLYLPVVTGSYQPPFPSDYSGDLRRHIDREKEKIGERIIQLEKQKELVYKDERRNRRNMDSVRRERVNRRWWRLESSESFEKRIEELRDKKQNYRRYYQYRTQLLRTRTEQLSRQQEQGIVKQKKLEKSYKDFMNLLTFVQFLEEDDFWRSEVVQIIAHTTVSGALEIDLVPRSGRYTILFGRIEQVEEKFDKLLYFYRRGLNNIGWDEYRTINVKYNSQVVCRK